MSSKAQGVKVSVLRHHTFRGKEYNPGDSYTVDGDESQTADQYLDSLRALNFARPVGEEGGPNYVEEVGEPGSTAVKPMGTEDFAPTAQPSDAPAAEVKPAAVKPAKPAKVAKSTAKAAKQPAKSGGKK